MGLTDWVLRTAPVRPLIVSLFGGTAVRIAVERQCRENAWIPAVNPAEADMLILCGPTHSATDEVEQVWRQMPFPKVRVELPGVVGGHPAIAAHLTVAVRRLRDPAWQRGLARQSLTAEGRAGEMMPNEHAGHGTGHHERTDAAVPSPHQMHPRPTPASHGETHTVRDRGEAAEQRTTGAETVGAEPTSASRPEETGSAPSSPGDHRHHGGDDHRNANGDPISDDDPHGNHGSQPGHGHDHHPGLAGEGEHVEGGGESDVSHPGSGVDGHTDHAAHRAGGERGMGGHSGGRGSAGNGGQTGDPEHPDHGEPADTTGHGGHDMAATGLPGGIPMADRASDRDGLTLDRLTMVLGPVLAYWPEGLVIRISVQGDVIQEATPSWVGADARTGGPALSPVARRLDSIARLLAVLGWPAAAERARWIRDDTIEETDLAQTVERYARLASRLRRSRTLRWLTAGVGRLGPEYGEFSGDAADRLARWLDEVDQLVSPGGVADRPILAIPTDDALRVLLPGAEVGVARLIVASLDPQPSLTQAGASHG